MLQKNSGASEILVYFEEPFWVLVYQRQAGSGLQVCRVVLGALPPEGQLYGQLLQGWAALPFGTPQKEGVAQRKIENPKRRQRAIQKQLAASGPGTKAQQTLKAQRQQGKQARKTLEKQQKDEKKRQQFAQKQQRRKQKHRGR